MRLIALITCKLWPWGVQWFSLSEKKDLNIIKIHFNQREQGVGFPSLITTRITSNLENLKEIARSKNDGVEVKKNQLECSHQFPIFSSDDGALTLKSKLMLDYDLWG